jgi:nucleoid DNA-binding protein
MAETPKEKPKAASKTVIFQTLAEKTGLQRKQVASVFDELSAYIKSQLGKKGPGVFTVPGLIKIKRVDKPAAKPRQITNPRTGEPMMTKAKPKRTVVKALALKALKEMVK